jgi:hypothetical protein
MKMAVLWVVAPCSLVEVYRSYRGQSDRRNNGGRFVFISACVLLNIHHIKAFEIKYIFLNVFIPLVLFYQ